jgi:hypothetical protein
MSSDTAHHSCLCATCAIEEETNETIVEAGEFVLCAACAAPLRDTADVELAAHLAYVDRLRADAPASEIVAALAAWRDAITTLGCEA